MTTGFSFTPRNPNDEIKYLRDALAVAHAELDAANKWVLDLGLVGIDGIDGIETRDAELAALRAELEQERSRSSESSGETTGSDERGTVDPAEIRRLHGLIAALRAQYAGSQAALTTALGELAEARADVQRFEAALDVSQRELAEARAADVEADILDAIEAVCELADAEYVRYREQWAGLRESVIDDNARDIGKVRQWLTERDIVRKGGKARDSRRTIRALVVAFRDALHLTRRVASDDTWNLWLQLVQRQAHERRESERNQTSRD